MREIEIYDVIGPAGFADGVTAKDIRAEIKNTPKDEPILLRIDSAGGSVFEAKAILSNLRDHPAGFNARVDGLAASAASAIFASAKERTMAEGAWLMIHNPYVSISGDAAGLLKQAAKLQTIQDEYVKMYARSTGMDALTIENAMAEETWYTDQEAVQNGFATSIVDHQAKAIQIAACVRTRFRHIPDALLRSKPAARTRPEAKDSKRRVDRAAIQASLNKD